MENVFWTDAESKLWEYEIKVAGKAIKKQMWINRSGIACGSSVDFTNINKYGSDSIQIVLVRMMDKEHSALFGHQKSFEAYINKSARFVAKDATMYENRKSDLELWEIQDVTPAAKVGQMDLSGLDLTTREHNYLSLYLNDATNNDICKDMDITARQGKYLKKRIVKRLKSSHSFDHVKSIFQGEPGELHSTSMADLRYRKVYGKNHAENKRIKLNENEPTFCSLHPACPWYPPLPEHKLDYSHQLKSSNANAMIEADKDKARQHAITIAYNRRQDHQSFGFYSHANIGNILIARPKTRPALVETTQFEIGMMEINTVYSNDDHYRVDTRLLDRQ